MQISCGAGTPSLLRGTTPPILLETSPRLFSPGSFSPLKKHRRSVLKGLEHLGDGWLWIPGPIAVALLHSNAALGRSAVLLLACMLLDLACVGVAKARCSALQRPVLGLWTVRTQADLLSARLLRHHGVNPFRDRRHVHLLPRRPSSGGLGPSTIKGTCTSSLQSTASPFQAVRPALKTEVNRRGCRHTCRCVSVACCHPLVLYLVSQSPLAGHASRATLLAGYGLRCSSDAGMVCTRTSHATGRSGAASW